MHDPTDRPLRFPRAAAAALSTLLALPGCAVMQNLADSGAAHDGRTTIYTMNNGLRVVIRSDIQRLSNSSRSSSSTTWPSSGPWSSVRVPSLRVDEVFHQIRS